MHLLQLVVHLNLPSVLSLATKTIIDLQKPLKSHQIYFGALSTVDESVFLQNIKRHEEVIKQSEHMFFGFDFDEYDDSFLSEWIYYSAYENNNTEYDSYKMLNMSSSLILEEHNIPPYFTNDDLARVSQKPILSLEECSEIVAECENHYWGWGSSYERYGTPAHRVGYMLKLEDLSRSYSLINFELLPRLFPAIVDAFPCLKTQPENLRLGGCRVVKYDSSEGRVELGMHRDGLLVTANIALNDDFAGGGTFIEGLHPDDQPLRLKTGHVLLHPGDVMHAGFPITRGVRHVLVCFVIDKTIIPHEKYCKERMQEDIEAAKTIPLQDSSRADIRQRLLLRASEHCANANAFTRLLRRRCLDSQ